MNNDTMVNILTEAVKNDIAQGVAKEELFRSLSQIVGNEICGRVRDRL